MKITWFFALLGGFALIALLVLLELGILKSPFVASPDVNTQKTVEPAEKENR